MKNFQNAMLKENLGGSEVNKFLKLIYSHPCLLLNTPETETGEIKLFNY